MKDQYDINLFKHKSNWSIWRAKLSNELEISLIYYKLKKEIDPGKKFD